MTQLFQQAFLTLYNDLPLNRQDALRHREKFDRQLKILSDLIDSGNDTRASDNFDCLQSAIYKCVYPDCIEQKQYNEELFYFFLEKSIEMSNTNLTNTVNLCIRLREFRLLEEIFKRADDLSTLGTFNVRTSELLHFLQGFDGIQINHVK